jgi:hypothetical protein
MRIKNLAIVTLVAAALLLGRAAPVLAQAVQVVPAPPAEPLAAEPWVTPLEVPPAPIAPAPAPPAAVTPLRSAPASDAPWTPQQRSPLHTPFIVLAGTGTIVLFTTWAAASLLAVVGTGLCSNLDQRDQYESCKDQLNPLYVPVLGPFLVSGGGNFGRYLGIAEASGAAMMAAGFIGYKLTLPKPAYVATVSVVPTIVGDVRALAFNVSW